MHFFTVEDELKKQVSLTHDDLIEVSSHLKYIQFLLTQYLPFTGDNHARKHFELCYQLTLIKSRFDTLTKELDSFSRILKDK